MNRANLKNIMFFTHHLNSGGAEKVVRLLASYINSHDLGYKAYVVVVYDDPTMNAEVDNLIVLNHKSKRDDSKLLKGINVIKQIFELKRIKRETNISACISFLPGADIINVFSGIGEKQIISVRAQESKFTRNIMKKWYIQIAHRRCDKIVAVSKTVKEDCINFFGTSRDKIATIYNPILSGSDENVIDEISDFISNSRVVIHVGRLSAEKGQQHLIRAFSELYRYKNDCKLLILGDGPEKENLKNLVKRFGIEDVVKFAGNIANPFSYIKKSKLMVLTSYSEGMPNVLLEALQCGVPCVSTDCGAREILAPDTDVTKVTDRIEKGKYGILVPVCTEPDYNRLALNSEEKYLVEAMQILLEDDLYVNDILSGAGEYIKQFDISDIVKKWIGVIE